MKAFAVLVVCISACVAVPNSYGRTRLDISNYVSPLQTTTTPAPIVYKSYDQPAIRIVNHRRQPATQVLRTNNEQPAYSAENVKISEQPATRVKTRLPYVANYEQPAVTHVKTRLPYIANYEQPLSSSHVKTRRPLLEVNQQPASHVKTQRPFVEINERPSLEQSLPLKKEKVPILKFVLNDNNNGNYQVDTLSGDKTRMKVEGTLKDVAGPEAEGPVSVMKGSYSYVGPDQKTYTVTYVADERGFMPMGEHLPTPHPEIQAALSMMGPGSD